MTKRELFVKAHEMTKEIVNETGVNYRAQFGICLAFLYKEEETVTFKTLEKKLDQYCGSYNKENGWYADWNCNDWAKGGYDRTYIDIKEFRNGKIKGTKRCGYWDNINNVYVAGALNILEIA